MSHTPMSLNPGETIIMETRRHPIALLPVFISTGLLLGSAIFGSYLAGRYSDAISGIMPAGLFSLIMMVLIGFVTLILVAAVLVYRQSRLILTNQNIMQVEQQSLFVRNSSKLSLDSIEDATSQVHGPIATVFGYGNLVIETAGEQANFMFEYTPHPVAWVEAVNKAKQDFLKQYQGPPRP